VSYVVYDRSLQRTGFRPSMRNPYGAAHGLSGKPSTRASHNPQYPFTLYGGWRLGQGQPAGVPTGAWLTYVGNFQTTDTMSAQDIINAISSAALPGLTIGNVSTNAGILANTELFGIAESGQNFSVTITLQVTGPGFAQPTDAGSIVNNAYYNATGSMPQGSSISVSSSGNGSVGGPPPTGLANQSITQWFEQNAMWIGIGLAAVVLAQKLI
jgi:hypothetical protein